MKTKLSLLFLLAAFAATAQVKLGINAGATQSGFYGNDVVKKNTYRTNFLAGLSVEVPLDSSFALIGNINYEGKSSSRNIYIEGFDNFDPVFTGTTEKLELKTTLHYITETVLARYYFGNERNLFVNAGLFGASYVGNTFKINGDKTEEGSDDDFIKSFDFGASFGIGAAFRIDAKNTISIELRDNLGLVDINNINSGDKIKTNNLNLIANWSFTL